MAKYGHATWKGDAAPQVDADTFNAMEREGKVELDNEARGKLQEIITTTWMFNRALKNAPDAADVRDALNKTEYGPRAYGQGPERG